MFEVFDELIAKHFVKSLYIIFTEYILIISEVIEKIQYFNYYFTIYIENVEWKEKFEVL